MHIRCTCRRERSRNTPTEDVVDSSLGPLFRGRHQMRVDAQGEARVGVSQVLRQGPDRLPRVEQDTCVEVPERLHAILAGRVDPGQNQGRLPHLRIDVVPLQGGPLPRRQEQVRTSRGPETYSHGNSTWTAGQA